MGLYRQNQNDDPYSKYVKMKESNLPYMDTYQTCWRVNLGNVVQVPTQLCYQNNFPSSRWLRPLCAVRRGAGPECRLFRLQPIRAFVDTAESSVISDLAVSDY